MGSLAEHRVAIDVDHAPRPIRLPVKNLSVSMDEEWIPYVQASVVCPLGDGTIATVDPQSDDVWATITARRVLGRTDRLADLSRRYRRQPLSALTTRFQGQTLAAISLSVYHDYDQPGHARREQTRTWRVMLRSVTVDRAAATVSMTLASGEARLTDWMHMSASTDRIPGANMVDKLNYILGLSNQPPIAYAPASVPTDAQIGDEGLRTPGSTALEFITGLTRHHDLMAWCDENAQWHLATDRSRSTTRTLRSAGGDRSVVNEVSTRSRDDNWVTAVMIVYTWDGQDHYDIYSPWAPNPEKALILRYNRPYPGPGMAANIFRQVTGRGRALELDAVSDYAATPGENVTYITPRESVTGRLAAVTWRFPDDEMSIRLREVGAA